MRRKVIQIANFTQVVSLPKKWVTNNNIEKGDELEVEEKGNSLVISRGSDQSAEKAKLVLKSPYKYHVRDLKLLYRRGYDEIDIEFDNISILNQMHSTISEQLMGFEITEQAKNYCKVKNLSKDDPSHFDSVLKRLFMINMSMADECAEAVEKKDFDKLPSIAAIERMNNKLSNLCERLLNKFGYKDYKRTNFIYALVRELEQMGDSYRDVCHYFSKTRKANSKETNLLKEVNSIFREVYELFYKPNLIKIEGNKEKREAVKRQLYEMIEKKDDLSVLAHYLIGILDRCNHAAESIL